MQRPILTGAFALALSACASSQPPAASPVTQPSQPPAAAQAEKSALNPVGTFEYSTNVQGQDVAGTFEIVRKADGSYGGRILSAVSAEIPITRVSVDGSKVNIAGTLDGQLLVMELTFTGDEFTGGWSVGDGSLGGPIRGKRKPI